MNHNTPLSPRPLHHLSDVSRRVLSAAQLRSHGVSAAETNAQCRPGGPWQQVLPGVFLLHPGPPTSEERLHAVLLYSGRPPGGPVPGVTAGGTGTAPGLSTIPPQTGALSMPRQSAASAAAASLPPAARPPVERSADERRSMAAHPSSYHRRKAQAQGGGSPSGYEDVMITGLAALTLHGFSAAPPLLSLDRIDVLVPRTRRLRSVGFARIVRTHAMPQAQDVTGLPMAPVPRALADAVAQLTDAGAVRRLLMEAVRGGHCEPAAVVRELNHARLLTRPHVVDAVDSLLAEGRAIAEDRLYRMVAEFGLPDPLWNVDLRLPGGPHLGGVDAYWPDQAVAVELDTRATRQGHRQDEDALWSEYARKREHLERLGITVVHLTPRKLRDSLEQQAAVVRTALMASTDREPAAYVVVLPR
ncbi:hypothetical protein [Streptomyces indicus]|uniref:Transcriptional regulator, AbiEi antitoxin, Type IV TA system n=1 Tax=Streptomyces indicus TaxID=417292 RepID=A0A1G9DJG7_9ACTN|nr:hypothetical protein [Streptomyces indicus]SDK64061.1 hypothetical protein SAMN05421806_109275 [Streptomyces indicus]